jgi:hypothetical protein
MQKHIVTPQNMPYIGQLSVESKKLPQDPFRQKFLFSQGNAKTYNEARNCDLG